MNKKSLSQMSMQLMIVTILIKITGFSREIFFSYFYGTGQIAEAYNASKTIVDMILVTLTVGMSTAIIPIYRDIMQNKGEMRAHQFIQNLLTIFVSISIISSFLAYLFADKLIYLVASGFKGETLSLSVKFIRIMIWSLPFLLAGAVLKGVLQANEEFIIANSSGVIANVLLSIFMFLSAKRNIIYLPLGLLLAYILQFIFYPRGVKRHGFNIKFGKNIREPYFKEFIYLVIPVIIGFAVTEINGIIDKNIASRIMDGGISILGYSSRLSSLIFDIAIVSMSTVYFSRLSDYYMSGKLKDFKKLFEKSIDLIKYILIPFTLGMILYSKDLVQLFYERGNFTSQDTYYVAINTIMYSLSMVFLGMNSMHVRTLYSMKQAKKVTPLTITYALNNIIFSLILSKYMGIFGISLGTSIARFIRYLMLRHTLKKEIGSYKSFSLKKDLSIIALSLISILPIYYIFKLVVNIKSQLLSLVLPAGISVIIYLLFSYIIKIDSFMDMLNSKK